MFLDLSVTKSFILAVRLFMLLMFYPIFLLYPSNTFDCPGIEYYITSEASSFEKFYYTFTCPSFYFYVLDVDRSDFYDFYTSSFEAEERLLLVGARSLRSTLATE